MTARGPSAPDLQKSQKTSEEADGLRGPLRDLKTGNKISNIDLCGGREADVVMQGQEQRERAAGGVGEGCRVDIVSKQSEKNSDSEPAKKLRNNKNLLA